MRMEVPRQDLRTEFRAATEASGLAGFGLASAVEEGRRMEDGGVKIEGGGCRARALTYVKRIGVGRAKSRWQRVRSHRVPSDQTRDPFIIVRAAQRRFAGCSLQERTRRREKRGRRRTEGRNSDRSGSWGKGWTRDCSGARSKRKSEGCSMDMGSGWSEGLSESQSGGWAGRKNSGKRKGRGGAMSRSRGDGWSWGWSEDRDSSKGSVWSGRCSRARRDAMTGGCSRGRGSTYHPVDSGRRERLTAKR